MMAHQNALVQASFTAALRSSSLLATSLELLRLRDQILQIDHSTITSPLSSSMPLVEGIQFEKLPAESPDRITNAPGFFTLARAELDRDIGKVHGPAPSMLRSGDAFELSGSCSGVATPLSVWAASGALISTRYWLTQRSTAPGTAAMRGRLILPGLARLL